MLAKLKIDCKQLYYRGALPSVALRVKASGLTYLSYDKLLSLSRLIRRLKAARISGDFVEFGIALGGSAIFLASELDEGRAFYGYDVFEMIPPPAEMDDAKSRERYRVISSGNAVGIGGRQYYGYIDNLLDVVRDNFTKFGMTVDGNKIVLRKGLFERTLPLDAERKIAFAHLDCDWYEPVWHCLVEASKRLSAGGLIVLDDYNDYGGCRKAVDRFVSENPEFHILYVRPHAVIRKSCSGSF